MSEAAPADTTPADTSVSEVNDDALAPPDPADIEEEGEATPFADEPAPDKKPAAEKKETSTPAPKKKPDAKPPPTEKKVAKGEQEEPAKEEEPPPEEEFEIEVDGKPVKLTKARIADLVARRKKLDTEAFQRLTEANRLSAPVRDLFKQIKSNPLAVYDLVRLAGGDPHASAKAYADEWQRQQNLTPEQRQLEESHAELARQKADLDRQQAQITAEEQKKELAGKRTKVLDSVTKALTAAKVPRHPTVLQLVGDHLAAQVRGQPEDFEPDYASAVESAQDGIRDASREWVNALPYEQILTEFPEVVKAIRAGDAARAKDALSRKDGKLSPPRKPPPEKKEEPKFLSPQEWGERMRSGQG